MTVEVTVPVRPPFAAGPIFAFLAARAVPGVEEGSAARYRRTVRLAGGEVAIVDIRAYGEGGGLTCRAETGATGGTAEAVAVVRRLFDVDARPDEVDPWLAQDRVLRPVVAATPGLRSPGCADGFEQAVRAVVGQQVSVAAARTVAARLVARYGHRLPAPSAGLTHAFPAPAALAAADPSELPMPAGRARALIALSSAVAGGELDLRPGADADRAAARLLLLPGIGPWTVSYVRMRAFGDADAFLATDLGLRRALAALGQPDGPRWAEERSRRWSPFRAYALHHLWRSLAATGEAGPHVPAPPGVGRT